MSKYVVIVYYYDQEDCERIDKLGIEIDVMAKKNYKAVAVICIQGGFSVTYKASEVYGEHNTRNGSGDLPKMPYSDGRGPNPFSD